MFYQNQVNICNQMKVAVERYFSSLNHLHDDTNQILTDWSSPQRDLAKKCSDVIWQRGIEVQRHTLVQPLIQTLHP